MTSAQRSVTAWRPEVGMSRTATTEAFTSTYESIRALLEPAPGTIYLDAASYGLPPRPTVEALQEAVLAWQSGQARWLPDWDVLGEECRSLYAELIGATPAEIGLVPTV